MQTKTVLPALLTAIFVCLISCFFIYYGIDSDQIVLSVIGGALLIVGILRLVLFTKAYREAKREIRKYEEGFHFCHKRWGLFLYAYIWRPGIFYRDGMVFLSEGMELHIALPDYCEMEDVYFTYSCHKQQE